MMNFYIKQGSELPLLKVELIQDGRNDYHIVNKWRPIDTNKKGRFVGEFNIDFLDGTGTLKAPIREELYINII